MRQRRGTRARTVQSDGFAMEGKPLRKFAEKGDIIILDGERMYVRERDRSVLSPNLGLLVCPAEGWLEHDDDTGSFWTRTDDYEIET